MAISKVLYQSLGPLQTAPIPFQSPVGGSPVTFYFGGSGYSSSPNFLTVKINLDGAPLQQAIVFSNEKSSHKSFVCQLTVQDLSFGPHTITFVPENLITDRNDLFMLTMIY